MSGIEFFTLKEFSDDRGHLVPVEVKDFVDWTPKRVYYAFNNTDSRGGHCHLEENELFVCVRGKMTARLHDGKEWIIQEMNGPCDAVRVDAKIWHEFTDFTEDAILLAVSSTNYNSEDYVHDFDQFLKENKS